MSFIPKVLRGLREARAARGPPPEPSPYPFKQRLDRAVSRGQCSGDPMPAVAYHVRVAVPRQSYRRRVVSLLEAAAVSLDRRLIDATAVAVADLNLGERDPDRRRAAKTLAHAASFRVVGALDQ